MIFLFVLCQTKPVCVLSSLTEHCSLNLAHLHPLKMTVQVCVWQQRAGLVTFRFHLQRWWKHQPPQPRKLPLLITSSSCRACPSWPRSHAGDITSRINWYWWTCLATPCQQALRAGDAQPPPSLAKKNQPWGRVIPRDERQTRMGLYELLRGYRCMAVAIQTAWVCSSGAVFYVWTLFTLCLSLDWQL